MKKIVLAAICLVLCTLSFAISATADNTQLGTVTNLPIPRFVSLKASKGNVRRGPSLSHRIDWILKLRNIPLQVLAEHGHWRKVVDFEGAGGWIHYSLLSGTRTILVQEDSVDILNHPAPNTLINAKLERNVLAWLTACELQWCQISADGYKGWAPKTALWGVSGDEVFE